MEVEYKRAIGESALEEKTKHSDRRILKMIWSIGIIRNSVTIHLFLLRVHHLHRDFSAIKNDAEDENHRKKLLQAIINLQ